jgi:hypothetical protein
MIWRLCRCGLRALVDSALATGTRARPSPWRAQVASDDGGVRTAIFSNCGKWPGFETPRSI